MIPEADRHRSRIQGLACRSPSRGGICWTSGPLGDADITRHTDDSKFLITPLRALFSSEPTPIDPGTQLAPKDPTTNAMWQREVQERVWNLPRRSASVHTRSATLLFFFTAYSPLPLESPWRLSHPTGAPLHPARESRQCTGGGRVGAATSAAATLGFPLILRC